MTAPRKAPARSAWLILLGVAVFFTATVMELWAFLPPQAPDGWVETPCTLRRFEIVDIPEGDQPFRAEIAYDYSLNGGSYTGNRVWEKESENAQRSYEPLDRVRRSLLRGPEGEAASPDGLAATCWVNPAHPEEACLQPGAPDAMFRILLRSLFATLMFYGLAAILCGCRRSRIDVAPGQGLFFIPFAAMGLAFTSMTVLPGWQAIRAQSWQAVPAEILWSRLQVHHGKSTSYTAQSYYAYRISDREYRASGDLPSAGFFTTSAQTVAAHPAGSGLTVYVNPADPAVSLIDRSFHLPYLFGAFTLFFVVIGVNGIWRSFFPRAGYPTHRAQGSASLLPVLRKKSAVRLRGANAPSFVVLLVSNAIAWTFSLACLFSFLSKPGMNGGLAIAGAFVLVSAGLLAALLHQFAGLLGPAWRFRVDQSPLTPGEKTVLRWQRDGGRGTPQSFRLVLVGIRREHRQPPVEAHRETLFEASGPGAAEMLQGQCSLHLPRLQQFGLDWQVHLEFRLMRHLKFTARARIAVEEALRFRKPRQRKRSGNDGGKDQARPSSAS